MNRIVHTIASTRADHGGTSRSVPALCGALSAGGAVRLVTTVPAEAREDAAPILPNGSVGCRTVGEPTGWRGRLRSPLALRRMLEQQVQAHGLKDTVQFLGPVADEDKWALYRSADLFALPTHSENFGIVVAEALASGLPVITTKGAPWQALKTHCCGWWTGIGRAPLARSLREAVNLTDA